jgi:hypothetical protein
VICDGYFWTDPTAYFEGKGFTTAFHLRRNDTNLNTWQ